MLSYFLLLNLFLISLITESCAKDTKKENAAPHISTDPVVGSRQREVWLRDVSYTNTSFRIRSAFYFRCPGYPNYEQCPNGGFAEGEKIVSTKDRSLPIQHIVQTTIESGFEYVVEGSLGEPEQDILFVSRDLIKNPKPQFYDAEDVFKSEWTLETINIADDILLEPGKTISRAESHDFFTHFKSGSGLPRTLTKKMTLDGGGITKTYYYSFNAKLEHENTEAPNIADFPNGELKVSYTEARGFGGTSQVRDFTSNKFEITVNLID